MYPRHRLATKITKLYVNFFGDEDTLVAKKGSIVEIYVIETRLNRQLKVQV
jgi:hypothetical protein